MLNQIAVMGRLVATPELKETNSGVAVTSFTLAVERDYVPKGEEKATDFIDVVCWRHTAEFVCKYFVKGKLCAVRGRLQTRNWEDKSGNKRKATEIAAESVYFCGGKNDPDDAKSAHRGAGSPTEPFTPKVTAVDVDYDEADDGDDLPF